MTIVKKTLYHNREMSSPATLQDEFTLEDGMETINWRKEWHKAGVERVVFQLYDVFDLGGTGEAVGAPIVLTLNPIIEKKDILAYVLDLAKVNRNHIPPPDPNGYHQFVEKFWE